MDIKMKTPLVFVDIDTQRDFLDPAGPLFIFSSPPILPNLERLTGYAARHEIRVLATACCHAADDLELDIFPPHCMAGTKGQSRISETDDPETVTLGLTDSFAGSLPRHLTIHKKELDLFSRADANAIIAAYQRDSPTFVVYGVATDYCVKKAVEGLLARGCQVAIVVDAIRAIDGTAEAAILTGFANQGVLLTRTENICQP
jgi:nicotinamidase/pyrazinamidase